MDDNNTIPSTAEHDAHYGDSGCDRCGTIERNYLWTTDGCLCSHCAESRPLWTCAAHEGEHLSEDGCQLCSLAERVPGNEAAKRQHLRDTTLLGFAEALLDYLDAREAAKEVGSIEKDARKKLLKVATRTKILLPC